MKKNLQTRLIAALLCMVMLFCAACSNAPATTTDPTESLPDATEGSIAPENGTVKIEPVTVKYYVNAEVSSELSLAHYEDMPEILLVDTETAGTFLCEFLKTYANYEYTETETTMTISRDNGAYCTLDFVDDTIYYNNYDLFYTKSAFGMASDRLACPYVDAEGNSIYFKRTDSLEVAGLPVMIQLADRNIPLDIYEGKKYLPFQTFSDLFLSQFSAGFIYNSQDLFVLQGGALDPSLTDMYYSIEPKERTQALANFAASELSLVLDLFYGLQDEHGIKVGFATYMNQTGLLEDLLSTDATKSTSAIGSLTMGYLADKHSALDMPSPYTGSSKIDRDGVKIANSFSEYYNTMNQFNAVRATVMPEGVPFYQEIGNTAYLSFDSFTLSPTRFQDYDESSTEIVDTLGMVIYAHSMINRENSPIENVVLDLSCNVGGAFDAAVYVVSWMLGYCDMHLINPITNGSGTVSYRVDVNLDKKFDESDSLAGKNLYCIVSPVSFSCGNLVPSLLEESGKVTLIGNSTAGGACEVQHITTADGTVLQFSSPHHLSVLQNGSYYTVDRGVDPHFYLSKLESYFNREALTEYINKLP